MHSGPQRRTWSFRSRTWPAQGHGKTRLASGQRPSLKVRRATPHDVWATLRRVILTENEYRQIAANVPPYLR
jgi:hypothetical protein